MGSPDRKKDPQYNKTELAIVMTMLAPFITYIMLKFLADMPGTIGTRPETTPATTPLPTPVPIRITRSTTDYWANMRNLNAQVINERVRCQRDGNGNITDVDLVIDATAPQRYGHFSYLYLAQIEGDPEDRWGYFPVTIQPGNSVNLELKGGQVKGISKRGYGTISPGKKYGIMLRQGNDGHPMSIPDDVFVAQKEFKIDCPSQPQ